MIVPAPEKTTFEKVLEDYPLTLTIVFLNLFFFWALFSQPQAVQNQTAPKSEFTTAFIESAGRYYLEWKQESQYGRQSLELQALGAQAVRNGAFLKSIETWKSSVDPVGFNVWKKEFTAIFKEEGKKPIAIFGLSQANNKPLTWITYQFSHQSVTHLFSNLILMVFFAACVEKMVGGFLMGVIYLMGGLMGGYFFMLMDQSGYIPMVGASASVTALIGFIAAGSTKRYIPYFYFFGPLKGWYGKLYLSPLWVISLFLLEDVTQILSDPPGWGGGVAHSAHLGGAFAGLVLGVAHRWGSKKSDVLSRSESSS